MSELDTSSTDANHWAKQMLKISAENNYELDEEMLTAWLANFWAAVHDPLADRIAELEKERDE